VLYDLGDYDRAIYSLDRYLSLSAFPLDHSEHPARARPARSLPARDRQEHARR
jgi:hypothetical protein